MNNQNYLVATIHEWNIKRFHAVLKKQPGNWHLITEANDLTIDFVESFNPKYIFFPHWSWIVKSEIVNKYDCICFHATDLPFGRGGSPIQNLIIRGYQDTVISALKMTNELDAGPIFLKKPLSLQGRAQEIFENASVIIEKMIIELINSNIHPVEQNGEIVVFQRRTDNEIPKIGEMKNLYNHIRMLDANGYPHAYIQHGDFLIKFSEAIQEDEKISAKVVITREILK